MVDAIVDLRAALFRRLSRTNTPRPINAIPPIAAPTPIPAFAPIERDGLTVGELVVGVLAMPMVCDTPLGAVALTEVIEIGKIGADGGLKLARSLDCHPIVIGGRPICRDLVDAYSSSRTACRNRLTTY